MLNSPSWIVALAVVCAATGAVAQDEPITDDSYFWGQSPPVYPVPVQDEEGTWSGAIAKARDLLDQMSLEEKVNLDTLEPPNEAVLTRCL